LTSPLDQIASPCSEIAPRKFQPHSGRHPLVGPSQLLFGTDYPFWSPNVAVKVLDDLGVAGAEREAIERGNALSLLPSLNPPSP
jgi:predicted TIM-barrel fold metal-dependent hydrolase